MLETPCFGEQSNRLFFKVSIFMSAFFIMKLGQFLIIPFLAIYLSHFSLSPLSIGIIIASGQLSHSITSLLTGHLVDRYNPQQLFTLALFGSGTAYWYLNDSSSLCYFILLNIMIGTFRAIFDNSSKTLLVIHINEQQRNFALGMRYAVLNLAAALGPFIGAHYITENSQQLFHTIAYSYFLTSSRVSQLQKRW